jgi:hypothetical protein
LHCPSYSRRLGLAGEASDESDVAPAAHPTGILGNEADPFEIRIALLIVHPLPRPRFATVDGFQDGAVQEVFQRDESGVLIEKEYLPSPFSEGMSTSNEAWLVMSIESQVVPPSCDLSTAGSSCGSFVPEA